LNTNTDELVDADDFFANEKIFNLPEKTSSHRLSTLFPLKPSARDGMKHTCRKISKQTNNFILVYEL